MMGFIAEFIVYRGSLPVFPLQSLLCMVGTGLTAVYLLIMINRAFFGRLPDTLASLPRVRWADRIPSVIVTLLIIFLGIQPSWIVRWSDHAVKALAINTKTEITALAKLKSLGTPATEAAIAPSLTQLN